MPVNRLVWIDFVRTIGIWLVVWGHFLPNGWLKQFIYSFHVPLFFVVSGYLSDYLHGGARKFRFRRLLAPYAIWTGISVLAYMAIGRTADGVFGWNYVFQSFLPFDGFVNWNAPLWFLYALFVVEAVATGIDEIKGVARGRRREAYRFSLFCIVVSALVLIDIVCGINMLAYRQVCLGVAFYMAGACLHRFRVMNLLESRMPLVILIALTGYVAGYLNGPISIWSWKVGRLPLLLLSGFLLTTTFMLLSHRYENRLANFAFLRVLSDGRINMTILCTHFACVYAYGRLKVPHDGVVATLVAAGVILAYYFAFHVRGILKWIGLLVKKRLVSL